LDEQLALIESRLDEMATRSYRREADGLLTHARFVTDSLRLDPFRGWLTEPATNGAEPMSVAAADEIHAAEATMATGQAAARTRERA
jgi:hypothetical protein